jgi:prenyltransferase beta subunit
MQTLETSYRRLVHVGLLVALALALCVTVGSATIQPVAAQSATPGAGATASPVAAEGLEGAVSYLEGQQAEDGGFPGFEGTSDPGITADAVIALAAAREAGIEVGKSIDDALGYLEGTGVAYAETGAGQRAKLILALVAAGADPTSFAGEDLVQPLFGEAQPEPGIVGSGMFDHALVTLAAAAVGSDQAATLAEQFASYQVADGSWAFDASTEVGAGDTNTTSLVIQALVAAGMSDASAIEQALSYLGMAQAPGGGFAYQPAEPLAPDANSTALAIQALIATGTDFSASEPAAASMAALLDFQNPSGGFQYTADTPDDNLFATVQAVPALAGRSAPVVPADQGATPVASPLARAA